jgi:hypothetical protein
VPTTPPQPKAADHISNDLITLFGQEISNEKESSVRKSSSGMCFNTAGKIFPERGKKTRETVKEKIKITLPS